MITACALPRTWNPTRSAVPLASFDFVLVSSPEHYAAVLQDGGQPILITRQFSVTDERGKLRLLLGGLIEPWRWRRVLLNEGISTLRVLSGKGSWVFTFAAGLARTAVTRGRIAA